MPISQLLFINGSSLSNSTAVYSNSSMTILAPDGWYSDGSVVRRQVSGVLQPAQPCTSCGIPCNEFVQASGVQGVYKMSIDTGTLPADTGAIVVKFFPYSIPDGIKVVFNGTTYNSVSSQQFGFLGGVPSGLPIFLGLSSFEAGCPSGSIIGGPFTLDEYVWSGSSFVPTGNTESITVSTTQDRTQPGLIGPGACFIVVPKTSPSPSVIEITCYGICENTQFDVEVQCPAFLKKFNGSNRREEAEQVCGLPTGITYFVCKVNGLYPILELYDLVFIDAYGLNPMPDGYYKTNNLAAPYDTIKVTNGVIDQILDSCP